jgi:hypothetical protein
MWTPPFYCRVLTPKSLPTDPCAPQLFLYTMSETSEQAVLPLPRHSPEKERSDPGDEAATDDDDFPS